MKKPEKKSDDRADLRKQAEKKLSNQLERLQKLSAAGMHDLVQELGTHQIELEMQNEELRKAQAELEASRNRYADLYDFAPVGYLTFDTTGLIREANLTAATLLNITRRSLMNKPFSAFVNRADSDAFRKHCAALLKDRTKQKVELRLKCRDNAEFHALLESVVVEDHEGNAAAIRTAISDIGERRKAEDALQQSELRYRSLFENMLDGYAYCRMLYDHSGRPTDFVYLSVNSAFERLTGLTHVVGMKVTDVIPGIRESHPELLETYGRVAATGKTEKFEIEFKPLGIWLSVSVYSTEQDHFTAVFDNISERKNAAHVLGRSEEKYRLLFENMAEGFALYELLYDDAGKPADWRILEVNASYVLHTGISRDRVVGRRMSELFPAAIPEYLPRFAGVVATQKPVEFETYSKLTNRHHHVVSFPAGPNRFANTVTDITERKRTEEALRESEVRYRNLFDRASDSVFVIASEGEQAGRIIAANKAAAEMHGYTAEELASMKIMDLDTPGSTLASPDLIRRIRNGEQVRVELQHRRKDGSVFPVEISAGLVDFGKEKYVLAFDRDITERKRAEEALRYSEEQYRKIVETANEGIWVVDCDRKTTYVNEKMAMILGYDAQEMIGMAGREFLDEEGRSSSDINIAKRQQGISESYELRLIRKDTTPVWVLVNATPLFDRDGRFSGSLSMITDITGRKQAEEAIRLHVKVLAKRNEELLRFNQAAVDRELRMIELKQEINKARVDSGKPPRYRVDFDKEQDT